MLGHPPICFCSLFFVCFLPCCLFSSARKNGDCITPCYTKSKWLIPTNFFLQNYGIFLCTGQNLQCWPTPISTQSSSSFKNKKWCKAITTTSVWTKKISNLQNLLLKTSRISNRRRLFASS